MSAGHARALARLGRIPPRRAQRAIARTCRPQLDDAVTPSRQRRAGHHPRSPAHTHHDRRQAQATPPDQRAARASTSSPGNAPRPRTLRAEQRPTRHDDDGRTARRPNGAPNAFFLRDDARRSCFGSRNWSGEVVWHHPPTGRHIVVTTAPSSTVSNCPILT